MSAFQIRLLAIACWLVAIVLVIPPLALYDEWKPYRDGKHVTADVIAVKPRRTMFEVTVRYDSEQATLYTKQRPGTTLDIVVPARRHYPIEASRLGEKRPSIWLLAMLGAAPLTIALGVMLWRAPSAAKRRRKARTNPLDAIVEAVRLSRAVAIGLAVFFTASAVFLAIVPFVDAEATVGMSIAIELLAAASLGMAVFGVVRARKLRDPRRNEVIALIEQRPQDITWFYVQETTAPMRQRGYSLHIWKPDGKQHVLNLVAEDVDAVVAELARRAPHAKQGYSPEVERAYRKNPKGSLDVQRKPDHTVIFVPSLCALLASGLGAALLIARAAERRHAAAQYTSTANEVADSIITSLADSLGLTGSIVVSAIAVLVSGAFFARAIRRYRAATR